jgi:hypothetical protein
MMAAASSSEEMGRKRKRENEEEESPWQWGENATGETGEITPTIRAPGTRGKRVVSNGKVTRGWRVKAPVKSKHVQGVLSRVRLCSISLYSRQLN